LLRNLEPVTDFRPGETEDCRWLWPRCYSSDSLRKPTRRAVPCAWPAQCRKGCELSKRWISESLFFWSRRFSWSSPSLPFFFSAGR